MAFLLRHGSGGYLAHGIKERVEVVCSPQRPRPASMGPPEMRTVGMFKRHAAISMPERNLVAAGDENRCVELVALHGAFDRVRDQPRGW